MADEAKTTGTESGDGGDAKATGTPDDSGRDAGSEPDYKKMYLESKDKIEDANRIRAERDVLKERLEQAPAATDDEPADGVNWAVVEDFARRGDEVAKAQVQGRAESAQLVKALIDRDQLRDIEDQKLRQETYELYQKNRSRFGDPRAALDHIQAQRLDQDKKKLLEENEKLRAALAASSKPDTDVVRTHMRDVPASEHKIREMTRAEWDADQARYERQWSNQENPDINASGERMARQRELRAGKIKIKD